MEADVMDAFFNLEKGKFYQGSPRSTGLKQPLAIIEFGGKRHIKTKIWHLLYNSERCWFLMNMLKTTILYIFLRNIALFFTEQIFCMYTITCILSLFLTTLSNHHITYIQNNLTIFSTLRSVFIWLLIYVHS